MSVQFLLALSGSAIAVAVSVLIVFILLLGIQMFILFKCVYLSKPDQVLIRCGYHGTVVRFNGPMIAFPAIHQIHRLYAGIILLKNPNDGRDWPVQLVATADHAKRAMRALSNKTPDETRIILQAMVNQEANSLERQLLALDHVGYAEAGRFNPKNVNENQSS